MQSGAKFPKDARKYNCVLCHDGGLLGGDDYPFAFCQCTAGKALQETDQKCANEANLIRDRLRQMFTKTPCGRK